MDMNHKLGNAVSPATHLMRRVMLLCSSCQTLDVWLNGPQPLADIKPNIQLIPIFLLSLKQQVMTVQFYTGKWQRKASEISTPRQTDQYIQSKHAS